MSKACIARGLYCHTFGSISDKIVKHMMHKSWNHVSMQYFVQINKRMDIFVNMKHANKSYGYIPQVLENIVIILVRSICKSKESIKSPEHGLGITMGKNLNYP